MSLKDSALGLATEILDVGPDPISVADLYSDLARKFESLDQFMVTLDLLYVLGRIEMDFESGVVTYVDLD
ncbi:hypothetical protein BV903_002415 [Lysobacter enzymogenes]|nr:hypothetical protein BV903_002415 [Lysobacter enzymogenes]